MVVYNCSSDHQLKLINLIQFNQGAWIACSTYLRQRRMYNMRMHENGRTKVNFKTHGYRGIFRLVSTKLMIKHKLEIDLGRMFVTCYGTSTTDSMPSTILNRIIVRQFRLRPPP